MKTQGSMNRNLNKIQYRYLIRKNNNSNQMKHPAK